MANVAITIQAYLFLSGVTDFKYDSQFLPFYFNIYGSNIKRAFL